MADLWRDFSIRCDQNRSISGTTPWQIYDDDIFPPSNSSNAISTNNWRMWNVQGHGRKMSLTDLSFQPDIMQEGLMKATACFSHDSWSPERGLKPEPPAEKQKFYRFDYCVSLRMRMTKTNLHDKKCVSDRLPEHRDMRVATEKARQPSVTSSFLRH
jgi:hypothetical protein